MQTELIQKIQEADYEDVFVRVKLYRPAHECNVCSEEDKCEKTAYIYTTTMGHAVEAIRHYQQRKREGELPLNVILYEPVEVKIKGFLPVAAIKLHGSTKTGFSVTGGLPKWDLGPVNKDYQEKVFSWEEFNVPVEEEEGSYFRCKTYSITNGVEIARYYSLQDSLLEGVYEVMLISDSGVEIVEGIEDVYLKGEKAAELINRTIYSNALVHVGDDRPSWDMGPVKPEDSSKDLEPKISKFRHWSPMKKAPQKFEQIKTTYQIPGNNTIH